MYLNAPKYHYILIFLIGLFVLTNMLGYGQTRTYLNGHKTGNITEKGVLGSGSADISSPMSFSNGFYKGDNTILTGSTSHFTKMTSSRAAGALGLNLAGGNAYIQFRRTGNLDAVIPANTTTYFTLGEMPQVTGVNLDVTGLLGITQESSLTGSAYIDAAMYTSNNAKEGTLVGSSTTKLLIDAVGKYTAAITPSEDYNSIRLKIAISSSLLSLVTLAKTVSVDVYNAYTETDGGTCSVFGRFTSPPEVEGIALNTGVIGLNTGQLIANPHLALTNDDQFASYSSGLASLGVGKTISQTIYFDHKATANDSFYAKLGLVNSLVGLDLLQLQGITFNAYNGISETSVWSGNLTEIASLLGLDLLNLINLGGTHGGLEITAKPGVAFDRIRISFNSGLLGLGVLGDAFRVYNIKLLPAAPTISHPGGQPIDNSICINKNAVFQVQANIGGAGNITSYLWEYNDGINDWLPAEGTNDQPTYTYHNVPIDFDGRRYRVKITGGASGCESTIISAEALLTVLEGPDKLTLTISNEY